MDGKFDRRIRPQREREIYRPGSGPLRRTDPVESNRYYKYDYSGRPDNPRDAKEDYDVDRVPHESSSYNRYDSHNEKSFDKDRKKTKKPDAGIYVPKQRTSRTDGSNVNESHNYNSTSHAPLDNQKPSYSNRDATMNRENEFVNNSAQYDNSHHQSRSGYIESKQFTRGYKNNDNQSNWKDYPKENSEYKKFDSRDNYDSQNQSAIKGGGSGTGGGGGYKNNSSYNEDRNTYYNSELKGSNNYHRYGNESFNDRNPRNDRNDRNDRGNANEKNRMGRSLSRRNSSNSISIPDAFSSWAPRLQRQFLQSKGIKQEDLDKYMKNRQQQQQQFSNSNRDNRYSQTLPPKNNRNAHFKSNNKENPRNTRFFQKPKPFDERPGTDQSGSSEEKKFPSVVISSEATASTEKSWNSNDSVQETSPDAKIETNKKNSVENEPNEESCKDEIQDIVENNDEDFNWAEEVEREQLYVERNMCEADDFHKNDENSPDKKKDRKKRRRREFRKRRGFSFERKQTTNRSRNPSENENQNRKKGSDDDHRPGRSTNDDNRTDSNDGYLSWRRNKNPSPSRNRLGIMGRNYRNDNKFDNFRNNSNDHEKISNKIKINNKINELPAIVREQTNANSDHVAGIIKIPQSHAVGPTSSEVKSSPPKYPSSAPPASYAPFPNKSVKQLYNPTNPKQPIIVSNQSSRAAVQSTSQPVPSHYPPNAVLSEHPNQMYIPPPYCDPNVPPNVIAPAGAYIAADPHAMSRPAWYDAYSKSFRSHNNAHLLLDISLADTELQNLLLSPGLLLNWEKITALRDFLQKAFRTLLATDLKFCETENVEQHMWKILFHNVIELLRKRIADDPMNALEYRNLLLSVINQGTDYFHNLIALLESVHKVKIDDFLNVECPSTKGLGLIGLVLISAQKIYLFLGDLARYKETSEESSSFTSARQWYIKANQLNPRNGKPYHQLALLAVCVRKKFDAVYYYMRSLMASNPFFSARDSLLALFDENRKKYEQVEKMRRELKEKKKQEKAKEKESVINGSMLRKEIWIRPDDGRRIQRTTSTSQECNEESDDELFKISAAEVNKRFLMSFLHVHGKLFCKVGMETLQEAAVEMLTEFKVLLSHSPLPVTTPRLLQLLALNMFAIDNGQLKDPQLESGYHSAVQESALVISLQMFSIIINRCIQLLREQLQQMKEHADAMTWKYPLMVHSDVLLLLPAVKLWCDWLFCHGDVWNPPPSCQDYRISGCGDCWSALATFINLLEELDYQDILVKVGFKEPILVTSSDEQDYVDMVKIPLEEDITLSGFTPLMYNTQPACYTYKHIEMELAQVCLRIHRILFFGTVFLCGIDPPVLKLHKTETGLDEYISVVEEVITPKNQSDCENIEDHWSDAESDYKNDDDDPERNYKDNAVEGDQKGLLYRKKELERIHQKREKYIRDKKETINKELAAFSVEMEIKPHYLVPDTNCFIDCLPELEKIVKAVSVAQRPLYSLMIPVVVLSELEGIARGARKDETVSDKARHALKFLQNRSSYTNIKCVTTRGSVLPSTRFTSEEDYSKVEKNDDKILTTCMNLCKNSAAVDNTSDQQKKIYREVVLLTEDRNLRVKALSSNMPVQTVLDFIAWADLH